jgi:glucose/mannose-6-phosphate isomerase
MEENQIQEENLNFPEDYLHLDSQGLLKQYASLAQDIKTAYELGGSIELPQKREEFDRIFFLGMGGSSISGAIIKMHLEQMGIETPIFIVEDYTLPPTITPNSLVFAISYSGNTEETLSAYRQAIRITNTVIALEDGGKLEEVCKVNRRAYLDVPKGYQPRTAALSYLLFPIIHMLERYGVIPAQSEDINHLVKSIQKPDFKSIAIGLSEKLMYSVPLIYASDKYYPIAYRFKCEINEHAKVHAFSNRYSEFNHNEICGYTNLQATYHIVTFRFDDDHRRILKRMDIVKDLTKKAGVSTTEIKLSGDHFLTRVFSAILIGDYTAFFLALRYKTDPSPVRIIEELKDKMGPMI